MDFLPPTVRASARERVAFPQHDIQQRTITQTPVRRGIGMVAAACVVVLFGGAERASAVTFEAFNYIGVPGDTNNNQASLSSNNPSAAFDFAQVLTRYTPSAPVKPVSLSAIVLGQDAFFAPGNPFVQYGGELDFGQVQSWTLNIWDHNPSIGGGQNFATLNGNVYSQSTQVISDFNNNWGKTFSDTQNTYMIQALVDGNVAPVLQGGTEYWLNLIANIDLINGGRVAILVSDLGIGEPSDIRTFILNQSLNSAFIHDISSPTRDRYAFAFTVEPMIQPPPPNGAIPEPGTAVLMICGGMAMALRRRGCRPVGA